MAYAIAKEIRKAALHDYPSLDIPEPRWEEEPDGSLHQSPERPSHKRRGEDQEDTSNKRARL